MSEKNFIRNNYLWWTVKFVSLFVQLASTWHVFTKEFDGKSKLESYFITICVAVLIDVLFIVSSFFIESNEVRTLDKIPFLVVNILLAVFIIGIGIMDENSLLALAPRIGIVGIVLTDTIYFISEVLEKYFNRDAIEQRIRNKQVIARRNQDMNAWKVARQSLKKEREQLMIERERKTLGITEEKVKEPECDEPGIILIGEDQYAWVDRQGNYHNLSATGKPYSKRGAIVAQKRANNGRVQQKV